MKLKKLFSWISGLFKKPEEEINIELKMWPFPVGKVSEDFEPRPKKKVTVPKATTRKPAAKKTVAKKAVAKKTAKKKAK